jgi:predicted phosphate transport protein (TIGR00153 family)
MAGILSYFLPKDRVFYSLFEEASDNLEKIAKKLLQVVHEPDFNKRAVLISDMSALEHDNDEVTHRIFIELGRNFITPFDREDIHALASALDDIADYIFSAGKKINFYNIDPISDQGIQKTAEAIYNATLAVKEAVMELRNLKNPQKIIECVIKINSIENDADNLFDMSIEKLFNSDVDAKELIKRRELYQVMETATDKCEDAGNVIESIVVKYT